MGMKQRDFMAPGRSLAVGDRGMAATSHPLAGIAAIDILKAGGTAADAAVAAVAALCVVEPHMTGIGGDCFCLVARPGAPIWGYNGSGRAAAAAHAETLWRQGVRRGTPGNRQRGDALPAVDAEVVRREDEGRVERDFSTASASSVTPYGCPVCG